MIDLADCAFFLYYVKLCHVFKRSKPLGPSRSLTMYSGFFSILLAKGSVAVLLSYLEIPSFFQLAEYVLVLRKGLAQSHHYCHHSGVPVSNGRARVLYTCIHRQIYL